MTQWADLAARARGLSTHLLSRRDIEALAAAPDLNALAELMGRSGFALEEGAMTPARLELAVRRRAAAALRILARWSGSRTALLPIVFEDEDRRSLRALVRGAVQAVSPEERLAGLVPTPALPEASLAELARQGSVHALATLLTAWNNPYGPPLRGVIGQAHPDLLRVEMIINRTYATRSLAGARSAGRRSGLVEYVRESIDLENALTAVALAGAPDVIPKDLFIGDGRIVAIDQFEMAVSRGSPAGASEHLARVFTATPYAPAFRVPRETESLEERLLRARIAALARAARGRPLGPAPLLWYALRVRAQTTDVSRTVWGVALSAPPSLLADAVVSIP
jgi:vacuolar-type H+-ATPase subunit C/Vma6